MKKKKVKLTLNEFERKAKYFNLESAKIFQ